MSTSSASSPVPFWKRRCSRSVWIAVPLVLAVCVWAVWEFGFRLPVGQGPAGASLERDAFTEVWTPRPVFLVGLGDSITAGLGARPGYGYFDRLLKNPPEEWPELEGVNLRTVFPHLQFTNLAMSGSTSLDHETRQLPRVPLADLNTWGLIVITSGGNDLIHNYGRTPAREGAAFGASWEQARPWITNYAARLESMLDTLNARFPGGCEVFLADIYDPTDGTGNASRVGLPPWADGLRIHAAFNEIIHSAAGRRDNVHVVPLHETFLGHGLTCRKFWRPHYRSNDPHYWFWVNLEDPNERGYDAIRRAFLSAMIEVRERWR